MNKNNSEKTQQSFLSNKISKKVDDIDLVDIICQLWRGKIIILITILALVAVCITYISLQPKKWTSSSIVTFPSAGQVRNYDAVLSRLYAEFPQDKLPITQLQSQLLDRFNTLIISYSANSHDQAAPFTLNVEPVIKGQSAPLKISVTASTAKHAYESLLKITHDVDKQIVNEYVTDMKRNIEQKEMELTGLLKSQTLIAESKKKQHLEAYKHALKIAEASGIGQTQLRQIDVLSDDTLFLLGTAALNAMITNENSKPLEFDKSYYGTQRQLISLKNLQIKQGELQSYSYVQEPYQPTAPDKQHVALKVLLSIIAGMIIGSSFILGRNILRSHRTTLD